MNGTPSSWDLTGQLLHALYIGRYKVEGRVLYSRVKEGGGAQHLLELSRPMMIMGHQRAHLSIDHAEVVGVQTLQ